ncbi:hypothetical protein [Fuchsiella alkaliacetigena]|uniref:hypothetical protein n=1 Tax=Fuchsiella alkaliacetigena TaxID=957042 RepID=UPI00200B72FB|nr:hypothetical protein [Fuchsiella alkaliacetigena]MCK8825664.1 hypothetical protein [Fuchsiella alkaliacetigena]
MHNKFLNFLNQLARQVLDSAVEGLWDGVWEKIFELVIEAEEKWEESGRGEEKKKWVIAQIMEYLEEHDKLSWLNQKELKLFLCRVIDAFIDSLNMLLGHNWIERVKELEEELWEELFGLVKVNLEKKISAD